jgi:hypothetical protein
VTWTAAARLYDRMSEAPTAEVRPYERDRAMPPATSAIGAAQSGLQPQVVLLSRNWTSRLWFGSLFV